MSQYEAIFGNDVSNKDDIIDSRNVIKRIEELEGMDDDDKDFDQDELHTLIALREKAEGCEDWQYGATLIRDSYFEEYAQELAEDIGAIDSNAGWPLNCIDWDQAARELQMDYVRVDFDGVDYWVR